MTLSIADTIAAQGGCDDFHWGIETVMARLRPGCLYGVSASGGRFTIVDWPENQWSEITQSYVDPPTDEEIREEYMRQQTIAACLELFKEQYHGTLRQGG